MSWEAAERGINHPRFEVPELAFTPADYTPWNPYSYLKPGQNGQLQEFRTMPIDYETIEILGDLHQQRSSERQLERSGARDFFQTGFDAKAELIFMFPKR